MHLVAWILLSAPLQQAEVVEVRGLKYYDGADAHQRKHRLDLFLPKHAKHAPVIMWIHGGAWTQGDKFLYAGLGRRFAREGFGFAAINYRLSPGVRHPEHVKDCARAFAWLRQHVGGHGGDPDRMFVMGHSAGGHLSALLALDRTYLKAHDVPDDAVKGVIPMSGVYAIPALPKETEGMLRIFPRAFGSDPAVCRGASPVAHLRKTPFPILVLTETKDTLRVRPSMEILKAAVGVAGLEHVEFADARDRDHLSIVVRMALEGEDPVRDRIFGFVRDRCRELDAAE